MRIAHREGVRSGQREHNKKSEEGLHDAKE